MLTTYNKTNRFRGDMTKSSLRELDICIVATFILVLATYTLKAFTDPLFAEKGISNIWVNAKYLTNVGAAIFASISYFRLFPDSRKFAYEASRLMVVFLLFALISCGMALTQGEICFEVAMELFKLFLPICTAYFILNICEKEWLDRLMVLVLIASAAGYLYGLSVNGISVAQITESNYKTSYSPLESGSASGVAIALYCYFYFQKKTPVLLVASGSFVLATFKRGSIAFALALLIFGPLLKKQKHISKCTLAVIKAATLIFVAVYFFLMSSAGAGLVESMFHQTQYQFSMGRSYMLQSLLSSGYQSYGYGSSTDWYGRSIEMDLIKIAFELTPLALMVFVNNYWDITKGLPENVFYMSFVFFNMITSHSLNSNFSWLLILLIIGANNLFIPQDNSNSHLRNNRNHMGGE